MEDNQKAIIYNVAKHFLDLADEDYLSARLLYKNWFHEQFIILGQQAIEKYLKSILLYNLISIKEKWHNLWKLFEDVNLKLNVNIEDYKEIESKILYFFEWAENIKYRVDWSYVNHESLIYLDKFLFFYRKYCQSKYRFRYDNIFQWKLEKIINKCKDNEFRFKYSILSWNNEYWGINKKKHRLNKKYSFKNPVFWWEDEINFLKEYIKIPKILEDSFKKQFNKYIKTK